MSIYTTQLRFICESLSGLDGQNYRNIIPASIPKIFDFYFPFWSEDETALNQFKYDFIRHFYTREIGAETVELWKLFLEDTLALIMPKYVPMGKALMQDLNILDTDLYNELENSNRNREANNSKNQSIKSSSDGETLGHSTSKTITTPETKLTHKNQGEITHDTITASSDTPQSQVVSPLDVKYVSRVDSTRLTDGMNDSFTEERSGKDTADNHSNSDMESHTAASQTTDDTFHEKSNEDGEIKRIKAGRMGRSVADLLGEYMEKVKPLEQQIFDECECLFMLVY